MDDSLEGKHLPLKKEGATTSSLRAQFHHFVPPLPATLPTPFLSPPNRSDTPVLFNLCSRGSDSLQCVVVVSYGFPLPSEMCFLTTVGAI